MSGSKLQHMPPSRLPRWLGTLQILTGLGLIAFWAYFFVVENRRPDADPVYLAFERSFPVPDLLWLTPLLLLGGWATRTERGAAGPLAIAAGGGMVFLGLLDVSFNLQHGRYTISLADGLLNAFINAYCLGFGVLLIVLPSTVRVSPVPFSTHEPPAETSGPRPKPSPTRMDVPSRAASDASSPRLDRRMVRGRVREYFADRHVTITGGSSGIGLALARQLAAVGAHVTILARRQELLNEAAKEIDAVKGETALPCLPLVCDVADREQVEAAFARLDEEERLPDVLINSAGIAGADRFERLTDGVFERTMRINFHGTVLTTRAALPEMKRRRAGHIVNISSVAGFLGVFGYAAYAPSKFAVWGFSEVLRSELKPHGIAVSVVCPPDTDTPQLREENKTKPPETKAIAGTVKVLSADAVAGAILRGVAKRRFVVIPGLESKFIRAANAVAPWLVRWVTDRKVAGTQADTGKPGSTPHA